MVGAVSSPTGLRAIHPFGFDVPHDPSDFGRCHRLLQHFPEWRDQLQKVADIFPEWQPMVDNWGKMEALYLRDLPTGRCQELYALMRTLVDEGRRRAGWKEGPPGCWKKDHPKEEEI